MRKQLEQFLPNLKIALGRIQDPRVKHMALDLGSWILGPPETKYIVLKNVKALLHMKALVVSFRKCPVCTLAVCYKSGCNTRSSVVWQREVRGAFASTHSTGGKFVHPITEASHISLTGGRKVHDKRCTTNIHS